PQFSLPHGPVANASVIVFAPFATMSSASGVRVPGTSVEIVFVFQSMLMLVSLYALKMRPAGAVPPSGGGGGGSWVGGAWTAGGGGVGGAWPHVTGTHSARTASGVQSGWLVWH